MRIVFYENLVVVAGISFETYQISNASVVSIDLGFCGKAEMS